VNLSEDGDGFFGGRYRINGIAAPAKNLLQRSSTWLFILDEKHI